MRVLAVVHLYVPIHNAGAETMLHTILRDFVDRGDECTVVFPEIRAPYRLDGITVAPTPKDLAGLAAEHDVVVTHLDRTVEAVTAARRARRPIVHLLHNDRQLQFHRVQPGPDVLLVPNSVWIDETIAATYTQRVICRPPVRIEDYDTREAGLERDAVVLVNMTGPKGADTFYRMAAALPDRPFVGVCGAYGVQNLRPAARHRNVEIVRHTAAIQEVYARARVVIMPSSYESWGRVAVEAMASGVPVIAHPTPGLLECLGDAGIFEQRADTAAWVRHVRRLGDPAEYAEASRRARARAEELAALGRADLDALHAAVLEHVAHHRAAEGDAYARPEMSPILDSMRAGIRCPVCHASGCSCSPSAEELGGLIVRAAPPRVPGEKPEVYRTWQGDYRYRLADAIARGLAPDPYSDEVPRIVRRRFVGAPADTLEALDAAYRAAGHEARAEFLRTLAKEAPARVLGSLSSMVDALAAGKAVGGSAVPAATAEPDTVVDRRVGDVLVWAGDDPERIRAALEAELRGRSRATLVKELQHRLAEGP